MNHPTRWRTLVVSTLLGLGSLAAVVLPNPAGATTPPPLFPQCPAVGLDTGCQSLITISPAGVASVATDPNQRVYDTTDDSLVGIVNNSNALVASVSLTGSAVFGLDGDGLCTATPTPCPSRTAYGPTGYEGPGTVITPSGFSAGTVGFTGNLAPGASRYFSLEQPTYAVASVSLLPNVNLTASPVTGTEGAAFTGPVATFTVPPSTAAPSAFSATINWGDGSTGSGSITQAASGGPYTVSGSHTYADEASFATSVTVTDNQLALNSATAAGTASIADAPITVTGTTVAPQTTGASFTVPVATFTDGNPTAPLSDFTASIDWGDGTTSGGSITSPGTVSGTHAYTSHGTYSIKVTVNDVGGSTGSATDTVDVADLVTTCSGSGCSGSITTPTQSVQLSSPSTTGTIQTTLDQGTGGFTCGDSFRHAPQTTTVTDTGLGASITFTVTFANASVPGLWFVPFAVCYQSQTPFKDLFGHSVTTGLLPVCSLPFTHKPVVAPCVQSITELPFKLGNVVEKIVVPAGDPRYH